MFPIYLALDLYARLSMLTIISPMMTIILGNLVTGFTEFFQPNSTVSAEEFRRSVDKMW